MDEELQRVASLANAATYDAQHTRKYIDGAPHLKHASLRQLYTQLLSKVYMRAAENVECPRALDLGAGEGTATLPLLALGAHVTAVDISESQLESLAEKCAVHRDQLTLCHGDIDETLDTIGEKFDIIVACSLLHHIPDYLSLIERSIGLLAPHGQFFSFQDPLRYDSNGRLARTFSDGAYISWRIFRGDVWGGFKRRIRRARGVYLPDSAKDNTEYHVTRNGVDQDAIVALLTKAGFETKVIRYFSTQSRLFQPIGAGLGVENEFAIVAQRIEDQDAPQRTAARRRPTRNEVENPQAR